MDEVGISFQVPATDSNKKKQRIEEMRRKRCLSVVCIYKNYHRNSKKNF